MPVSFALRTELARLSAGLEALAERLTDWRAAWPSVTRRLAVMLARQFELEGGRGSRGRRTALSPRAGRPKPEPSPGLPALPRSRRLRGSIARKSARTG